MKVIPAVRARLRAVASTARFGRFVSVGVAGGSLETVVVAVLTAGVVAGLSIQPLLAKAVGAEASITLMFLLNDRWTFAGEGGHGILSLVRRYVSSHAVRIGGLAVAFATLYVLTAWTSVRIVVAGANLWPTIANGVGIVVGMTVNFVAESLITWRVYAEEGVEGVEGE